MGIFKKKNKKNNKKESEKVYNVDLSLKREDEELEDFFERAEKENLGKWIDVDSNSQEDLLPNLEEEINNNKEVVEKLDEEFSGTANGSINDEFESENEETEEGNNDNKELISDDVENEEVNEEVVEISIEEKYLDKLYLLWKKLKERFEINKHAELSSFLAYKLAAKSLKTEKTDKKSDSVVVNHFKLLNFSDSLEDVLDDLSILRDFEIDFEKKNVVDNLLDEVEFFLEY